MKIVHGACGAEWSGISRAHCSGCCETFDTVPLFEQHRDSRGPRGTCKPPAALGATQLPGGVWTTRPVPLESRFGRPPAAA